MNQLQTQRSEYWVNEFDVTDGDIEQIYNHFLEVEVPQTTEQITEVIVAGRVAQERNQLKKLMSGRAIYQPKAQYAEGDELVFPALKYAQGTVEGVRHGFEPQHGEFDVIQVKIKGKQREFAANLPGEHKLNLNDGETYDPVGDVDIGSIYEEFGPLIVDDVATALEERSEFVRLSELWFVKQLLAEVNIGHLHLTEAILEVSEGGPLPTEEILGQLEMDDALKPAVLRFSLNYALANDPRFDEVGRPGHVAWYLRRLEPEGVQTVPERLRYEPVSYDDALLSPQLRMLERELDDEWSDLEAADTVQATILSLTYPHRWAGTLPLSARTRPLFPAGISPRTRVILIDEQTDEEMPAWVVGEHRYVLGLKEWYAENGIPVGGFVTLRPGPEAGIILLNYDRRRPQREWVRLARVEDNQLKFELERRSVACGYDDLLIVGTDYVSAVDALARRWEKDQKSLSSILIGLFGSLAKLNPQETVHTKTLYSAVNMVRRTPPGPLFAELIRHPGFQPVGDHYWQYTAGRS